MFIYICIIAGTLLSAMSQGFGQNSFGIVPLQSTRADVERLYGASEDAACRCNFRTPRETVSVAYSSSPCAGAESGWNVPKDTVLSFTVTPYVAPVLSDIPIDLNGFVKRSSPEDIVTTYYTNVDKGIVLAIQDRRLVSIKFFPARNESQRRCKGFPPSDGVPPPRPFATIFTRNKEDVHSRLDNFAFELSTNTQARGYIVTYAGKKSYRGEAKEMSDEARQYLIKKRMISPDRIVVIDGGFRETAEYDLFSLGPTVPSPTPTPTVPSNEVSFVTRRRPQR